MFFIRNARIAELPVSIFPRSKSAAEINPVAPLPDNAKGREKQLKTTLRVSRVDALSFAEKQIFICKESPGAKEMGSTGDTEESAKLLPPARVAARIDCEAVAVFFIRRNMQ